MQKFFRKPLASRRSFALAGGLLMAAWLLGSLAPAARAAAYTNITAVNVSARGFAVVWGAATDAQVGLQIYADPDGRTNLAGQVGVAYFPLRSGSPTAVSAYDQRVAMAILRQQTRSYALAMAEVTGCRPGTDYYFRIQSISGGTTNYAPSLANSPLAVRTAAETAFVAEALQLLVDVPGQNVAGRIVLLAHTNSPYPLAAVVGDGAVSNQVVFNVSEMLALGGSSNFTASGSQLFRAEVLGVGIEGGVSQDFLLNFSGAFVVAQTYLATFSSELASFRLGSAVIRAGQPGSVPVRAFSTTGLQRFSGSLEIPDGHLSNLVLVAVAPEVDPAQLSLTRSGPNRWALTVPARAGQQLYGDLEVCRLQFDTLTNVPSAFVSLKPVAIDAVKPNSAVVSSILLQSGRVVVVGREPLIEPLGQQGAERHLLVYGRPWASFLVEGTSALGASWETLLRYPSTTLANEVVVPADPAVRFYRAADFQANPPILALGRSAQGISDMLVYGQEQGSYTLQYKSSLSPAVEWQNFLTFTISNSFGYVGNLPTTNSATFYRLIKN